MSTNKAPVRGDAEAPPGAAVRREMILKTIGVTVRTVCGRAAGLDDAPEDSSLAGLGLVGAAEDAVRTEIERLYGVELPQGAFAEASTSTPRLLAARVFASWDPGSFPVAHERDPRP